MSFPVSRLTGDVCTTVGEKRRLGEVCGGALGWAAAETRERHAEETSHNIEDGRPNAKRDGECEEQERGSRCWSNGP